MERIDHLFVEPTDFGRSLEFYQDTLRMEVISSWGGNNEPRGAVLQRGEWQIVLGERLDARGDKAWNHGVEGHRPTVHIACSDINAVYASLPDRSAIAVELEKTHWGVEWFVVKDPDDNLIAFFQQHAR